MASHLERDRGSDVVGASRRASVRVLVGPAGSGKTGWLLGHYRCRLAEGPMGCALWIAPNGQAARDVRDRLLDDSLPVCCRPNVVTFAGFADALVSQAAAEQRPGVIPLRPDGSGGAVLRRISDLVKRSMLRRIVGQRCGTASHFAAIARTQGFVDALAEFISELKRAEIWPDELLSAAQRRGASAKEQELVALYRHYQNMLAASDLYDGEGLMWLARDVLARGYRGPFAEVRSVVVDGFTDFTRTQYDMLEALAGTADELLVSLPYEHDADRKELFATTAETVGQLRRRFDAARVEFTRDGSPAREAPRGLAALERGLFRHLRRRVAVGDGAGIEILEAPGREGEVRMVAQRVKKRLLAGVAPDEVAVVVRRLEEYATLVGEVFREQGIPFSMQVHTPLARCPAVKALMAVLMLPDEHWRFARLAAVLKSNYSRPRWPEWSGRERGLEILAAIRQLRIPFGRDAYLRALERTAERSRGESGARAKRAAVVLGRLAECLERFPQEATPDDWVAAMRALAEEVGIDDAGEGGDEWLRDHGAALERLFDALEQWAWAQRLHGSGKMPRTEFLRVLSQILRWESIAPMSAQYATVRILSASEARNVRVPYLFVAGLAEGGFPLRRGEDPFFGESERESLSRQGVALGHRTARLQEEMMLFYSVVTRAEKQLVLSYPAVDDRGEPLLASPFLDEVRQCFSAGALAVDRRELLDAVPVLDEVAGPADLRVRAVADAAEGHAGLLARWAASPAHATVAENVLAGLRVTHARFQARRFGPFDGIVAGGQAAEEIAARFGPNCAYSPSQLGTYQTCPFRFYLSSVLRVAPREDPTWRSSPLVRGQIVHQVLAEVHRSLRARDDGKTSPAAMTREEWLAEYAASLDRAMRLLIPAADRGLPLWDLERRLLLEWGDAYWEQHREYEAKSSEVRVAPRPAHFELSFGTRGEAGAELAADNLSVRDPLVVGEPPGEVRVCGRIDRVDVGCHGEHAVFNIIDYKTGMYVPKKKDVQNGKDLQLPLYALAVERLFAPLLEKGGATGLSAHYWKIRGSGLQETLALGEVDGETVREDPQWAELRDRVEAIVTRLADGIRRAEFPVYSADDECTRYCPYATVCRVHQVRSVEKPWPV